MTVLVEVDKVSKSFGGVVANHDISISVPAGEITGLIGPNGSGKTTLFNSIVGFHPIDSGSIRFKGREITTLRVQHIASLGMLRTFQQTRRQAKMYCINNILISVPHPSPPHPPLHGCARSRGRPPDHPSHRCPAKLPRRRTPRERTPADP